MKACLHTFKTVDNSSCREIGSFYMPDQFINRNIPVIYIGNTGIDHFTKIMGKHIGSHTNCYTNRYTNESHTYKAQADDQAVPYAHTAKTRAPAKGKLGIPRTTIELNRYMVVVPDTPCRLAHVLRRKSIRQVA